MPRPASVRTSVRPALAVVLALSVLPACDSSDGAVLPGSPTITVLVAYTSGAAAASGEIEAHIRQAISETNAVYEASGVEAHLQIVHLAEVPYTMTERFQDLARLLDPDDGYLDGLHTLRDAYAADVVVLASDAPGTTVNAAVMAVESTAFVIVQWPFLGAPKYGIAHEVGHLLGARHQAELDPLDGPFAYGHAFSGDAFRTIMSNGPGDPIPYFASPRLTYEGVVLGDSLERDVARALSESAVYVSNFRGPQTPTDFVPSGTWPVLP